ITSQSGKGGVAYILQRDVGFHFPRWTQIDFSRAIQQEAENRQTELTSDDVMSVLENTDLNQSTLALQDYESKNTAGSV
ncbi:2-isopropylmalate synthase, partial [Mycobacterium tuberculosis]|nr:2-isopropylmalate synthase [Mycobacterium tuberculosis]